MTPTDTIRLERARRFVGLFADWIEESPSDFRRTPLYVETLVHDIRLILATLPVK